MCVCVRDVLVVNGRERVVLCIDVNFSSVVGVCKCREMRANFKTRPRGGARGGGPRPAPAVYGSACVTGRAPVLTGHEGEQESERASESQREMHADAADGYRTCTGTVRTGTHTDTLP